MSEIELTKEQVAILSPTEWEEIRKQGLAITVEDLPALKEGLARAVHITSPNQIAGILARGLDYSDQGMLMSTARVWSEPGEVEFTSDDPRFAQGIDVILDIPFHEIRLHNDPVRSPGLVMANRIVGVIDPRHPPTPNA